MFLSKNSEGEIRRVDLGVATFCRHLLERMVNIVADRHRLTHAFD
jgi:hypothetical protein